MTDVHIILKGSLKKKSPKGISGLRAWQKRFFFLFDGQLAYAKSDDVSKIQGVIPLSEVTSIEKCHDKPTRIRIEVANRKFDLDAGSSDDSDNWIAALKKCWITVKEKQAGSVPAATPTAMGKFWKTTVSGAMPFGGVSPDNLTAPTISVGFNSKAFTPIKMTSLLEHSGYFGTLGRTHAYSVQRSQISRVSLADTVYGDIDSNSESIAECSQSYSSAQTSTPKVSSLIKNAIKRSQSMNKSLTLFSADSVNESNSSDFGYADFERVDKIADCSIGALYRANFKPTGDLYLLQFVMKRDELYEKGDMLIKLMNKTDLQHPFFVRLVFSGHTPDRAWAAYTFIAAHSTLLDRLRTVKRLPEYQACLYLAEIVQFTAFLHESGRMFRNMKPEYIGLDSTNHVMVLDMEAIAFSCIEDAEREQLPIDDVYDDFWTPELISGHGESILSDWWRLGSLLYELLVGFPPFRAKTRDELIEKIQEGALRFPPFMSDQAQDFIKRCLMYDLNHRLGVDIHDILDHCFFASINWTSLHWKGLTKAIPDAVSEPPVRVKVKVKEGSEFPEISLEPVIRLTYGGQCYSTLPHASSTAPVWNSKFEFHHNAVAAAHNAMLNIELCTGQIAMAFAHQPIDLGIRGSQKLKVVLSNGVGIQIGLLAIEVKVKDTNGKVADNTSSPSRRILRRSITSNSTKGVGRSRRPSVLSISRPHRRASLLQDVSGKLSGKLRSLVSKNKHRFQVDGFDLDLTYLTSQIIVMGFPSSNLEGVYRNPMEQVQRFVKTYHDGHCRVINLCSERSYDAACFDNNVACFPFDDHTPPQLKMIVEFCRDVKAYLDADPENVVAAHCKAGKGRTGVMASSFLLYTRLKPTAAEALNFFNQQRTADGKGVTIPSQIRAVHTFEKYLLQTAHDTKPFKFDSNYHNIVLIRMTPEPDLSPLGGCDPFCRIYKNRDLMFDSLLSKCNVARPSKGIVDISVGCTVNGDIKVAVYHKTATGKKLMCSFWINMDFADNNHVTIEKNGLDKADKSSKLDSSFRIDLLLKSADEQAKSNPKVELMEDMDDKNSIEETENESSSISAVFNHSDSLGDLYSKLKRKPLNANSSLSNLKDDNVSGCLEDNNPKSYVSSTSNHSDAAATPASSAFDAIEENEEADFNEASAILEEPEEVINAPSIESQYTTPP